MEQESGVHDHGHRMSERAGDATRRLALVAIINGIGFVLEVAGGLLFGSVALLSDAAHMLFDGLAYGMAFGAATIADRYDTSDRYSFGLHRLEPLSAFLNGILLVPMVLFILYESGTRFLNPVAIDTVPTIALASGGLLINLVSVVILQGEEMSLNERGAFYHLLGDAGASVAVIVSTVVIEFTGFDVVDPITAALIALVVLWSAGRLLRGSGAIFLHAAPLTRPEIEARLHSIEGVDRLVDCHTWLICSEITVATVKVAVDVGDLSEASAVSQRIHDELRELGVDHATVELAPFGEAHPDRLNAHGH